MVYLKNEVVWGGFKFNRVLLNILKVRVQEGIWGSLHRGNMRLKEV